MPDKIYIWQLDIYLKRSICILFASFYYCVSLGVRCDSSGTGGHLSMGN